MSDNICYHLDRVPDALKTYNLILGYYVTSIAVDGFKRKATDAYCRVCEAVSKQLHACLECAFFGCLDSEDGKVSHMQRHSLQTKHFFAISINHGFIFCFKCGDYVYNENFEDSLTKFMMEARKCKVTRSAMPWRPNASEIVLLRDKIKKTSDFSYIGLRGLINVGYSCYINCILQVLMHTPALLRFFYSDRHVCSFEESCFKCELFCLFQEFYSGVSIPYDPSLRFFAALQKFCNEPLGREQQDCYELLQEILDALHVDCQKKNEVVGKNCNCKIQQIFYGIGQGFKDCQCCGNLSYLPTDYFIDILLDLGKDEKSLEYALARKCLEPQLLSDYVCPKCRKTGATNLYQRVLKLSTVICFRVNCFDLDSIQRLGPGTKPRKIQKKSTAIDFDEFIDLSLYINSKKDFKLSDPVEIPLSEVSEAKYQLFAVVFHKGNIEGGHYAAFIRQRGNRWFECDDQFIYESTLEKVLRCEPFLLFYQK